MDDTLCTYGYHAEFSQSQVPSSQVRRGSPAVLVLNIPASCPFEGEPQCNGLVAVFFGEEKPRGCINYR